MKSIISTFLTVHAVAVSLLVTPSNCQLAPSSSRHRMALTYGNDIDLEDVAAAVDLVGGRVQRKLACTRGLVIDVDDVGRQILLEEYHHGNGMMTVFSMDDVDNAHRQLKNNGVKTPQGDGLCDYKETCGNLDPVSELTDDDVQLIKDKVRAELLGNGDGSGSFDGSLGDSAGAIMRLVFHDAASFDKNDSANLSGLNGCVNKFNSGNAGLENVQLWLSGLQSMLSSDERIQISIADLTVLAAITTLEVTLAKARQDFPDQLDGDLDIVFRYGRPDIGCDCEEDFLPPALTDDGSLFNSNVLDETMHRTMGFTRKQIAALMGTHTLGGMAFANSGFSAFLKDTAGLETSTWVGPNPGIIAGNDGFDNGYYRFMIAVPWDKKVTVVDGIEIVEWLFFNNVFLNSDGAIGFEIDFIDEAGKPCNRFGGFNGCNDFAGNPIDGCVVCPPLNNAYGQAVREYAANNAKWLADYSSAFQKMVDELRPCRNVKLIVPTSA